MSEAVMAALRWQARLTHLEEREAVAAAVALIRNRRLEREVLAEAEAQLEL
jgi:hypothetical protein